MSSLDSALSRLDAAMARLDSAVEESSSRGYVAIEIQGRDASYIKTVKVQSPDKRGPFAIQVGSFTENINAVRLSVALRPACANAYIQETLVNGTTFYRVRIGNFDQLNTAMETAEKLGQERYPALVLRADVGI